ncbi:Uncharacterised protein [[Clostridium] sordellii]|uniref:Nucleotidyltransferase family protein n=1 Tax=Paraclostridium sordellii TaxID=1505 RepID=A0A0C7QIW5_PARSO|nr:hypothetical protein [Paeniclostridium sordellii]CEQ03391.1 Uncharacterised protein [[Clostridium] sordellii] [Paeniclostridium sordellii]
MFDTLSYIGDKLNKANILWGVGASILLNQFGMVDTPNDIDIFIDIKDIHKADKILKEIGEKREYEKTSTYSTKYFYEYVINGIDIDVMAGFAINHDNGVYNYIFDNMSISEYKLINGVSIPFTSLEDWYVIYQLIPNREFKVDMIEKYLLTNGVKKDDLLKRSLDCNLPLGVKNKLIDLLYIKLYFFS